MSARRHPCLNAGFFALIVNLAFCGSLFAADLATTGTTSAVDAFVHYAKARGIHLVRGPDGYWAAQRPKARYKVIVSFRTYEAGTSVAAIRDDLMRFSILYMLNEPALLAMSYPGVRGEFPKGKRIKDIAVAQKLIETFKSYAPAR